MSGIASIFYRDYRQRITNIGFVFWDLFAPLAYLTLSASASSVDSTLPLLPPTKRSAIWRSCFPESSR